MGVFGSGAEEHALLAEPLGRFLALAGVHLLTGGGRGVMTAAARAFTAVHRRRGLSLGILPGDADTGAPPDGYPNPFVEVAVRSHLPRSGASGTDPRSRNHLTALSCTAAVALPGGSGTRGEIELAVRYGRPAIAWLPPRSAFALPPGVPVAGDLAAVQAFLANAGVIPTGRAAEAVDAPEPAGRGPRSGPRGA